MGDVTFYEGTRTVTKSWKISSRNARSISILPSL